MSSTRRVCVLIFALCGFAAAPAAAQSDPAHRNPALRAIGFEVGANMNTLGGADSQATSWAPGFLAGVFFTPKPDAVTWQIAGLIHRKLARIDDVTIRTLRLEFPLMLRANIRSERRLRFHVLAGASAGLRLESSLQSAEGIGDLSSITPTFEYSAVFGAGVDVAQISVGVRLHQGLNTTHLVVDDQQTRNRSILVVLGYRIN